jgi:hypothetical protein
MGRSERMSKRELFNQDLSAGLKNPVHTSSRQHNILYLGFDIGHLILHTNSRQGKNAPEILDSNSRQKKTLVIESTVTKVSINDESSMF